MKPSTLSFFNKLTISFFLRHSKNKKKPSTIYCYISINGIRCVPFSTNEKAFPDKWNADAQQVIGQDQATAMLNHQLTEIKYSIRVLEKDLIKRNQPVTGERLKSLFLGEDKIAYTFIEMIDKFMLDYEKKFKHNTVRTVRSRTKNIIAFLKATKRIHLLCQEFNMRMAKEFETWIKQKEIQKPGEEKKGLKHNSALKNVQVVRQILKFALRNEYIERNPLPELDMKAERYEDIAYLSSQEVEAIESHAFGNLFLERVRHIFLFCVYTGISYCDAMRFNHKIHTKQINTRLCIAMRRRKTNKYFVVPLSEAALAITSLYDGRLPMISNQKYNQYIKDIGLLVGIEQSLHTHMARKTFAMNALNSGFSLEEVASMLGDTPKVVWECYARLMDSTIVAAYEKIYG